MSINKNFNKKGIILKVIFFPLYLLLIIFKAVRKKISFSIRLKLSLVYISKFFSGMIWAGLGIIIIFGSVNISTKTSENFATVSKFIKNSNIYYSAITKYSAENKIYVSFYDINGRLSYTTDTTLVDQKFIKYIGLLIKGNNVMLSVNNKMLNPSNSLNFIVYTDISLILSETVELAKIVFFVVLTIFFFSAISIARSGKGVFSPLKEMTNTVKGISENNLNLRLNVSGSKNELKDLAITFNEMMNRIEEDYNRQKQFVSDASHELRTPIAVINGYADMLDRWGKNDIEILQESIDAIKNESKSMQDLVDKLLFLARNDKGTLILNKEEFSLTELLLETVKETQLIDNNHEISCEIKDEISIYADRNRIKQALRIFIDNAIKYTPNEGLISISLVRNSEFISISIKDSGIGMTVEELQLIFHRFYQSEKSRSKEKGGHGLGLAIAKIIVLAHNGKIKVKSKQGVGSEFTILLNSHNEEVTS